MISGKQLEIEDCSFFPVDLVQIIYEKPDMKISLGERVSRALNKALDKDTVKIYLYNRRNSKKQEGDVVEVIERFKTEFVGVLQLNRNFGFVVPDDSKMYADIFIPEEQLKGAKDGVKVFVGRIFCEVSYWIR